MATELNADHWRAFYMAEARQVQKLRHALRVCRTWARTDRQNREEMIARTVTKALADTDGRTPEARRRYRATVAKYLEPTTRAGEQREEEETNV